MKKTLLVVFLLFTLSVTALFAQSADSIQRIADTDELTIGQACYLAICYVSPNEANLSFEQSFERYKDMKMFKNKTANEPIRLDRLCVLMLESTGASTGLWYKVGKLPHYALQSIKKKGLVPENAPPTLTVSGRDALNLFSMLVDQVTN